MLIWPFGSVPWLTIKVNSWTVSTWLDFRTCRFSPLGNSAHSRFYRPHPKDDGRLYFQSVHTCRGEGGWGTWSQVQGGVPGPRSGGVPSSMYGGVPHPDLVGEVPSPSAGGVPGPMSGSTPPDQVWMEYPPCTGTGYPPLDQVWIRQSSIASTCYAAGSVPLAFTQEDFLVYDKIKLNILRQNLHQTCFNDFSNVKWCMNQT